MELSTFFPEAELGIAARYGFPESQSLEQLLDAGNYPGFLSRRSWFVCWGLIVSPNWWDKSKFTLMPDERWGLFA